MTIAPDAVASPLLTYEAYLAEGEVFQRYDILDGVRHVTNPTRRHQDILLNVAELFRGYQRASGVGRTLIAPCDLLITQVPLRTRQPDVLFISHERLSRCPPATDPAPLEVGPELVVEILSPSETASARAGKLRDYCAIGVDECWIVYPDAERVEVLRLTVAGAEPVAGYGRDVELRSQVLPGLALPVAALFAP
jgi:Uma2 family endonuclease